MEHTAKEKPVPYIQSYNPGYGTEFNYVVPATHISTVYSTGPQEGCTTLINKL